MFKFKLLFFLVVVVAALSCNKENELDELVTSSGYTIEGSAQKGPFINGSNIVVYELNDSYIQTGKSFNTTTGLSGNSTLKTYL